MGHCQTDAEMAVQNRLGGRVKRGAAAFYTLALVTGGMVSRAAIPIPRLSKSRKSGSAGQRTLRTSYANSNGLLGGADLQAVMVSVKRDLEAASVYEGTCYAGDPGVAECSRLPKPPIDWTSENTTCPFTDAGLCWRTNSTSVRTTTGYININHDLGLNGTSEESLDIRRSATCSPMQSNRFDRLHEGTIDVTLQFYYGPIVTMNSPETYNFSVRRVTITDGYRLL
jgi:hypothetical protein